MGVTIAKLKFTLTIQPGGAVSVTKSATQPTIAALSPTSKTTVKTSPSVPKLANAAEYEPIGQPQIADYAAVKSSSLHWSCHIF